jgi:hypothetical protein
MYPRFSLHQEIRWSIWGERTSMRMNDIDNALVNYGAAALLDRCNPIIYFNRAIALHTHDRDELAIKDMGTPVLPKPSLVAYKYRGVSISTKYQVGFDHSWLASS